MIDVIKKYSIINFNLPRTGNEFRKRFNLKKKIDAHLIYEKDE